jgi:hypothetical protein
VRAGVAALEPMHHQAQRPEVEVFDAQQAHLAGAQPMAVGEQKQCPIADAPARGGEQPAQPSSPRVRKRIVSVRGRGMGPAYIDRNCPK